MRILGHITIPDAQVSRLISAHGASAQAWIDALPELAQQIVDCWHLTPGSLLHAGMESIVIEAEHASGRCVLKLMVERDDYLQQVHILKELAGQGFAPDVVANDDRLHAVLMRRVDGVHPADPCSVDSEVRQALARLARSGLTGSLSLEDHWYDRTERTRQRCQQLGSEPWQVEMVEKAYLKLLQLIKGEPRAFLHGDLHIENVLVTGEGDVVLIDFWGLDGPAIYDVAMWLAKTSGLVDDPVQRIASVQERQWLAAMLPSQAMTIAHYNLGAKAEQCTWQLALDLALDLD